jgi:hypothetical protein
MGMSAWRPDQSVPSALRRTWIACANAPHVPAGRISGHGKGSGVEILGRVHV